MQQRGIVKESIDGYALVYVQRNTACGACHGDCDGCISKEAAEVIRLPDPIGLQKGDIVVLSASNKETLLAALLVFVVPILSMLLFGMIASIFTDGIVCTISALVGIAVGFIPAILHNKNVKTPLVRIERKAEPGEKF